MGMHTKQHQVLFGHPQDMVPETPPSEVGAAYDGL